MSCRIGIKDLITPKTFLDFQEFFTRLEGLTLFLHDAQGKCIYGDCTLSPKNCRLAMEESYRWGEASIQLEADQAMLYWSIPVMLNNVVLGGVGACGIRLEDGDAFNSLFRIREAAESLYELMIKENLLNQARMELAKSHSKSEQEKAEAIHLLKDNFYQSIQSLYTEEEPALLNAIRCGQRAEATEILNRIFVVIFHYGSSSQDLLKSYLLELVAMMSRAAVAAGSVPEDALGLNFQAITRLAELEDDEGISEWLNNILERLFAEIQHNQQHPHSQALNKAFAYMQTQVAENLKRETVARHVGLSSSHFAHLLSTHTGKSFRELLTEFRVDKAVRLLNEGSSSLAEIAQVCGFSDQSHFSRVFSKVTRKPPGEYRKNPHGMTFRR
jgi:AraC-like DNA-binding protein